MAFVALADEVLHAIKSSKESTKLELCGEAGRVLGDTLAANTPLKELNLSADKGAEHESRLGAPFAWPPTSKSKFTFVGDHDSLLHWRPTSIGELLPSPAASKQDRCQQQSKQASQILNSRRLPPQMWVGVLLVLLRTSIAPPPPR
jgi:hypothetical protein